MSTFESSLAQQPRLVLARDVLGRTPISLRSGIRTRVFYATFVEDL